MRGWEVERTDDVLTVIGATAAQVGDVAGANGLFLHELRSLNASLEDAFHKADRRQRRVPRRLGEHCPTRHIRPHSGAVPRC
jgi:hypothetical protein